MSKRKRRSLGQAMGQAIVGFDYQVFRATAPPPELVEQGKPIAPVPAADGGRISIALPDAPALEPSADGSGSADPDPRMSGPSPSRPTRRG